MVLALICAITLCAVLTACGGGGSDEHAKNFTGEWTLAGMEEEGESMNEEDLALMEEMGLVCTLTLSEDKKAKIDLFGDAMEGTWEPKDASTVSITLDGSAAEGKLSGDKLTLEESGSKLIFKKA